MNRISCYVDETGQHTKGKYFFVAVVVVDSRKEELAQNLIDLEAVTGKHISKWIKTKDNIRTEYVRTILSNNRFQGMLFYGKYVDTLDYIDCTVDTVAKAIQRHSPDHKATVIVDGLRKSEQNRFATLLRKRGIRTHKIRRGEDEKDPFIRLADALCGFLADVEEGREEFIQVRNKAVKQGILLETE